MNRWSALALLLAVAGALALRCPKLDARPMHNDEAVNAIKLRDLWEKGRYTYDPQEFHGPTLPYATLPFLWLGPAPDFEHLSETTLRLAPVAFGTGLILLLLLLADGLGRQATVWAAVFTAVSPAMVFYSRDYIHELPLVFFTALTLAAAWRYVRERRARWAVAAGAGLGLMYATKETAVINVAAMAAAAMTTRLWNQRCARLETAPRPDSTSGGRSRRLPPWRWASCPPVSRGVPPGGTDVPPGKDGGKVPFLPETQMVSPGGRVPSSPAVETPASTVGAGSPASGDRDPTWKHAALAAFAAAVVALVLFSSFFKNPNGPLDSLRAYLPWLHRAGGDSPHNHPWYFYLDRLAFFHQAKGPVWSEGLILTLASVGVAVALFGRRTALARFLAFYTVILTAAYSAIPYKTPWCLLSFLHGMILLAGIGAAALVGFCRHRTAKAATLAILAIATFQLARQAWLAGGRYSADRENPYVYAQTDPDILNLVRRVEAIARVHPLGHDMVVKVIAPDSDYWPLPWYLRRFNHVGWWDQLPPDPFAPLVIVSSRLNARLDAKSNGACLMTGQYELRPGDFMELYVEPELWRRTVETLPREPE